MDRHLVVGLGNPGPEYAGNRHNVGFVVVQRLARRLGIALCRTKFKGTFGTGALADRPVVLLTPGTFMNLSGRSVAPACSFYQVDPGSLLVVHDELDLPFGRLRLKAGGGHAGHNGLRSIIAELGSADFGRLRIGIGRPAHGSVSDFVLGDFPPEERVLLPDLIERALDAVERVLREGIGSAMNQINASEQESEIRG